METINLNEVETLAKTLIKAHGLGMWRFRWNTRKRSFGMCKYSSSIIELSSSLTPFRTMEEIKNTILHEIAHALVGTGHGHDYVWRQKFIQLGGNGERCSSMDNVDKTQIQGVNWIATCVNGHVHVKFRKPTRTHSCGQCSNRFDRRYILTYERMA